MRAFVALRSVMAPLPDADIDTDIIFPARFLLLTQKEGLGRYAFYDRRHGANGTVPDPFVLDQARYRSAEILLAGANFGCGSSREQAVWSLLDLGIRCIISSGFGEIFEANCMQNGILPIVLPEATMAVLWPLAWRGATVSVDLDSRQLVLDDGQILTFPIAAERREALLNGWDQIAQIRIQNAAAIAAFETAHRQRMPWLFEPNLPLPSQP